MDVAPNSGKVGIGGAGGLGEVDRAQDVAPVAPGASTPALGSGNVLGRRYDRNGKMFSLKGEAPALEPSGFYQAMMARGRVALDRAPPPASPSPSPQPVPLPQAQGNPFAAGEPASPDTPRPLFAPVSAEDAEALRMLAQLRPC